tara:strand:- start:4412 stop:4627 length:216 start_codon:yes stop_codon:yes gene_type:complete
MEMVYAGNLAPRNMPMLNLNDIAVGQRLRVEDGRVGTVRENIGDGQWLEVSFGGDETELVHSQDIVDLVDD